MKLPPLLLDDKAKAEVQRVRDFAEKPENWYLIGPGGRTSGPTPGDNPRYRVFLGTYRCVFTWTRQADGQVFRHLSISVPSENYPNPVSAFEIATLFGFTGYKSRLAGATDGLHAEKVDLNVETKKAADAGWVFNIRKDEHCIVIAQKIPPEDLKPKAADIASLDTPTVA